ncbi:MAG: sigma-70 family RNA polymerase sigma factor [Planctomycetes bacterium]|nr:sigma-70 family RNA polymerase sigma factor [Planctomycetota bacterium]
MFALRRMTEISDDALIDAVLAGEGSAFGTLMDRYQDRVFRLVSRFTRDHGEAEDLAQEVFVKVFRKLHTFQRDAALFTWIYRVAVNTVNDHFGRVGRRRLRLVEDESELDASPSARSDGASPSQPVLDDELRRVTRELLDELPEKYRTILLLREFEDLSYTQLAETLGLQMGTVESRLFRARQRFKDLLEKRYPDLVPGSRAEGRSGLRREPGENSGASR